MYISGFMKVDPDSKVDNGRHADTVIVWRSHKPAFISYNRECRPKHKPNPMIMYQHIRESWEEIT
jgi:hypothetical protein